MTKEIFAEEYWNAFRETNPLIPKITPYQVWFFGNSQEMSIYLANFVVNGTKRATASLVLVNEKIPENAPTADGYSVVTDFEGNPLCIIQTTEIRHVPFLEVDFSFAKDEGEGFQNIDEWRKGHREYFTKECLELGFEFDETMLVCCERFRLLYPKFA
jgi:uncharacterized protein YhfF